MFPIYRLRTRAPFPLVFAVLHMIFTGWIRQAYLWLALGEYALLQNKAERTDETKSSTIGRQVQQKTEPRQWLPLIIDAGQICKEVLGDAKEGRGKGQGRTRKLPGRR